MSQHPSSFRNTLLAALALSSTALAACVAEAPARPGVDYGYVAGTYSTAPAQTPYAAAPYDDPYYDPYYDSYSYNGPYYGGTPYYGSAYYGSGYYYGPSTTYIYRDHNYPNYGYRSRGNSYREDRRPSSSDNRWRDRDHDSGTRPDHGSNDDHRGDSGNRGNWNHDRPGRPDSRPGNTSSHQDKPPRPVMSGDRAGVVNRILNSGNRAESRNSPATPAQPDKSDKRRSWRDQRDRN